MKLHIAEQYTTGVTFLDDQDGMYIACTYSQANADEIIQAVNAYDDLVTACKAAQKAIGTLPVSSDDDGQFRQALCLIEAAIENAENKP